MTIGERIAELRKSRNITQKDFGDKIGVAANTVTNYEAGRREPMEQTLKAICREFGASYEWLKYETGEMLDSVPETLVDELAQEFGLDDLDRRIILGYLRLEQRDRAVVKRYISSVLDACPRE